METKHRLSYAKRSFNPYTQDGSLGSGYNIVRQLCKTLHSVFMICIYTNGKEPECSQGFLPRSGLPRYSQLVYPLSLRPLAYSFFICPSGRDHSSTPCIPSTLLCCPPWQACLWRLPSHLHRASAAGSRTSQDGTLQQTWPSLSRKFGIIVRKHTMVEMCTVSRTMAGIRSWPQKGETDYMQCLFIMKWSLILS